MSQGSVPAPTAASPRSGTGPVGQFVRHHFRHFNAAALVDAADAYSAHMDRGGAMMITLAGAMSTAELGLSLAEMIRQDKVQIISCTGANLEEDVFNLIAHDFYERLPHYRDLTPEQEQELLERHLNRVTDTAIPEGEAMRRLEDALRDEWVRADQAGERLLHAPPRPGGARHGGPREPRRQVDERALGRPAAARCAGPRARHRASGAALRRAAVEPR